MSLQQIQEQLSDVGIHSSTNFTDDGKPVKVRRVECRCGAHTEIRFKAHAPPAQVIQSFVQKGWSIGRSGGQAFCPSCAPRWRTAPLGDEIKEAVRDLGRQGKSVREIADTLGISVEPVSRFLRPKDAVLSLPMRERTEPQVPEPEPTPAAAEPVEQGPSLLSIAQICSAISFLNRYFHDGRYAEGWSDARIASVLELFPEQVKEVRLGSPDHGPVRTAPEVEALKADIASLEQLLGEQISELRARLAPLEAAE